MNWNFEKILKRLSQENSKLLLDGKFGIEREGQRIVHSGELALTPHPAAFGNKLENTLVTTDFSESQIELITPPFDSVEQTYEFLKELHKQVERELGEEYLWPLSMPPRLPEEDQIPIAKFDHSIEGREKELYRVGLATRYGRKMQMISGIHFNFSFGSSLVGYLFRHYGNGKNKQRFINDIYFSMARNFLRNRWLLIYLFGASPGIDQTYYSVIDHEMQFVRKCCPECCNPLKDCEQNAVSLRLSRFGYSDSVQGKYSVSYNSLEEYVGGIRRLLSTKSRKFTRLGLYKNGKRIQLNGNVLQKESEFYSSIRLKQIASKGETQLDALEKRGVKYAEVRIIDLNPFEKTGIGISQLRLLQIFMLFCLFESDEPIGIRELEKINKNHQMVALSGRKQGLKLYKYGLGRVEFIHWSKEIFNKLTRIAELMDHEKKDNRYQECLKEEYKKVIDPNLLPSSSIVSEMKLYNESYLDFGIRKAVEHRESEKFTSYLYHPAGSKKPVKC